jgi:ribosome biogenesis protein ENP2
MSKSELNYKGVYAPMVKIFETSELSLKCERGIDSEIIQMRLLTNDYSKFALLCEDRTIELHAQYGRHYKLRIPRFGRDFVSFCSNSLGLSTS